MRRASTLIGEPRSAIDEQASCINFGGHIGQLELDGLKFADCFSKLLALLRVFRCRFKRALRHSESERSDGNSAAIQNLQNIDESFSGFAEHLRGRNAAIGENYFGSIAGADAKFIFFFAGLKSGHSLFQNESRNSVRACLAIGDGHRDADVGVMSVGGESFRAVQEPTAVGRDRGAACAARVGTGFRLCQ